MARRIPSAFKITWKSLHCKEQPAKQSITLVKESHLEDTELFWVSFLILLSQKYHSLCFNYSCTLFLFCPPQPHHKLSNVLWQKSQIIFSSQHYPIQTLL